MGFKAGIVGLPNVGKSTLFNALSREQALVANYPFATVEPNVARVPVDDPRLSVIAEISRSARIVPTTLDLVDIAGLVRGASRGEGLGNQFLAHIREVDAIIEVVRAFRDPAIVHVEGEPDPLRDLELIETELLMSDIEYLERRRTKLQKEVKGDPSRISDLELLEATYQVLNEGRLSVTIPEEIQNFARSHNLLSFKPLLIVVNIGEEEIGNPGAVPEGVLAYARRRGVEVIPICAKLEAELSGLSPEEERSFLKELGIVERGLVQIVRSGYRLLRLVTFFTTGPQETRAWTVREGTPAVRASGKIHSDFERGFIRAEVVPYEDFVQCGGWQNARSAGKVRLEGKEYLIRDGDIVYFRVAV